MPILPLKPCILGGPDLRMNIDIVSAEGESIIKTNDRSYLVAPDLYPSMTKSLWLSDERYIEEYWRPGTVSGRTATELKRTRSASSSSTAGTTMYST